MYRFTHAYLDSSGVFNLYVSYYNIRVLEAKLNPVTDVSKADVRILSNEKEGEVSSAGICHPEVFNLLTPNVNYSGRTAPLTSKVAFYIFIQQI